MKNILICNNYTLMIDNAITVGSNYVKNHPAIKAFVLGISGGVDSALTTYLARQVCDQQGLKLVGCYMPIHGNKADERDRAIEVGKKYCDEFNITQLDDAFLAVVKSIDPELNLVHNPLFGAEKPTHGDKVRAGNIKARLRMIHLYNLAHKNQGIVLSTDNFTEYLLGFWTLHGDVGDFGFIQEAWKTEVYGMADATNCPVVIACADSVPTDGLGITNSDIDQLLPNWTPEMGSYREAYRVVDDILLDLFTPQGESYTKDHPVVQRHLNTEFKRLNPVNIKREILIWKHLR